MTETLDISDMAQPIYGAVILDYLKSNESTGVDLTDAQLLCAAQALSDLPQLSVNNSRNEVQSHVLAALYEKDAQGDTFDKIQAGFYLRCSLIPAFPYVT